MGERGGGGEGRQCAREGGWEGVIEGERGTGGFGGRRRGVGAGGLGSSWLLGFLLVVCRWARYLGGMVVDVVDVGSRFFRWAWWYRIGQDRLLP